ncbi:uncharacterized protein LOC121380393 [Gigantopelta aegis]|nr:uncharacterized protein LOC121380393 [Gigantopelta aegis]
MNVFQDGRDDMDAYLTSFERMSIAQKSPQKDWAIHLGTLLTGKARDVYVRLNSEDAMDYDKLKNALLHRYDLTQEGFRQKFRTAKVEVGETYTQFLSRMTGYVHRWIKMSGINQDFEGLFDLLLREQLLNSASTELTLYLKERTPESADKMASLAETFVEARKGAVHSIKQEERDRRQYVGGERGRIPGKNFSNNYNSHTNSHRCSESHRPWAPKCFVCDKKGHIARECPNRNKSTREIRDKEVIACMVSMKKNRLVERDDSNMNVFVGTNLGKDTTIIRDTGCSTVVIRKCLVPENDMTGEIGSYVTLDGEVKEAPWCETYIKTPYYTGKVRAMVLDNPIYDIVIGNVIGAKDATKRDIAQTIGIMETRAQVKRRNQKMQPLITPTIQIEGVNPEQIRAEQRKDEGLEKLFKLAEAGEETLKGINFSKFVIENELLKRKSQSPNVEHGKLFDQLVVPTKLRVKVMRVAHETVLAGHMATQKTINRVQRHFYWPGLQGDIRRFCQSCDVCQRTIPKGRVGKALLGKMPVIDVPFERVAVDLVGPIDPMTDKKNRYILVVVDFATRYPEAVALKNIDTRTVAEALLGVFGRVGMPKEILTDRGTQFTSDMMKEVCRLLSMKQLTTTPYHPMCNGLVERFNGTLKSMLKKMCIERPKDWDRYIAPLLFAYREVPQDSIGFSPFELLYGRTVRGPMQILKELWTDEITDPEIKTTYQYVIDLRERLEETCMLAHNELEKSSTRYRKYFNSKAKDRQLKVGDQVLLLLPKYKNKLEMMWQGPNRIVEKLGSLDYRIKMDNGKVKTFHVNMLKKYLDRPKEENRERIETVCVAVVEEEVVEGECTEKLEGKLGIVLPSLVKTETWERCELSSDLDRKQIQDVKGVLQTFQDVLSDKPGRTDLETFKIELTSEEPVRLKPYPIPFSLTKVVKEEVDQMLELDVIEKSHSAYASPIVLVKKKEGTYRFCTDYRRLNQIVVYDAEPIPNIDELLSKISGAKFFTKIDLCKGYWQIPVEEDSRDATAFVTPNGLYHWKVMPFGIVSAPAVFSRMMRTLLKGLSNVRNYIDDILIYTETWEEHLEMVETVFNRLRDGKLTAKPSKCLIGFKTLEFLGHMVGNGEIGPEAKKVKKIMAISRPQNKKELRSFLGLIGYYRKFIKNFSEIAAPLTDMTKNSQTKVLQWTEGTTAAFKTLKEKMSSAPVLKLPKLGEHFTIRTDASGNGLGAVLMQESEGEVFPVLYVSRKLKDRETRYATIEKECLAIVWAIGKFTQYVYGVDFTLETDHQSLTWLHQTRFDNARVMRWALALQPYRFVCKSIHGKDNVCADLLSRCGDSGDIE